MTSNKPKSILVIQLRQLGDILLTTPIAREIKKELPQAKVHFLAHSMGKLILDGSGDLDSILYYHEKMKWTEWAQLLKQLRSLECDLAFDFMDNPRSAFFCLMSGANRRVGRDSWRRWAYNITVPRPKPGSYIVSEKFEFLTQCGFHPKDIALTLPVSKADEVVAAAFVESLPPSRPIVVLSPTHRRSNRQWPISSFAELADALSRNFNAVVVWIWGPGEEGVINACMEICKTETWKAPATKFREMAAIVKSAQLLIANSNGPSHVAVAMNTPSIQLHGPTAGTAWCPNTKLHQFIQAPSAEYADNEKVPQQGINHGSDHQMIAQISVEDVLRRVKSILMCSS